MSYLYQQHSPHFTNILIVMLFTLSGCCDSIFKGQTILCPPEFYETTLPAIPDSVTFDHEKEWKKLNAEANWAIPSILLAGGPSFLSPGEDGAENSPLFGYQLGFQWSIPLSRDVQFTPGFLYRSIGNKSVEESVVNDPYYYHVYRFEELIRLSYLDIQPLVSYSLSRSARVAGGPRVGYLIGARREHSTENRSTEDRSRDGLNDWNLGVSLGAYYRPSYTFFEFGLALDRGVSSLYSDNGYSIPGDAGRKYSNIVMLSVVYNVPLAVRNRRNSGKSMSAEENRRRTEERKRKREAERDSPPPRNSRN